MTQGKAIKVEILKCSVCDQEIYEGICAICHKKFKDGLQIYCVPGLEDDHICRQCALEMGENIE